MEGRLLFLLIFIVRELQGLCTSSEKPTSLAPITQFSTKSSAKPNLSHLLSTDNTTTMINFSVAYVLDAYTVLEPGTDCSMDCLTLLTPRYHAESDSFVMTRPDDIIIYSGYESVPESSIAPVYCTKSLGFCGADLALYLYFSEMNTDYYVSVEPGVDVNSSYYSIQYMGTPLCYVWSNLKTTTTLYTTFARNTTSLPTNITLTSHSIPTKTSSEGNVILSSLSGSVISTTLPRSSPVTSGKTFTTTSAGGILKYSTKSTPPSHATSEELVTAGSTGVLYTDTSIVATVTNEQSHSDHAYCESSKIWKWIVITVSVIVIIGLIVAVIALLTFSFINMGRTSHTHPYESGYRSQTTNKVNTSSTIMPPPLVTTSPFTIGLQAI